MVDVCAGNGAQCTYNGMRFIWQVLYTFLEHVGPLARILGIKCVSHTPTVRFLQCVTVRA